MILKKIKVTFYENKVNKLNLNNEETVGGGSINIIEADVNHKFFLENSVKYMEIMIEDSNVILKIDNQSLKIKTTGYKPIDILEKLMFEVLSLIFYTLEGILK